MGDSAEDFEPLFDYRRVQPTNVVFIDDDNSDAPPIPSKKRQKTSKTAVEKVDDDDGDDEVKITGVSSSKDLDEEDWLPPPPVSEELGESSTIKELRLKKQELESLLATSTDSVLQAMEESARRDLCSSEKASLDDDEVKLSKPSIVRDKVIITVQDKDGEKQYRVYKDEPFESFFKKYADKVKLCLENLVFIFDGDKVNPTTTPDSLGMEDDDIIEVRVKKS